MSLTRFPLAALVLAAAFNASSATFTVTSSSDSGPGTLRQAILDANATPGADQIVFAQENIFLDTPALPAVTDRVNIDGPARITIANPAGGPGPFTFAAGSSGSRLIYMQVTGAGRIDIAAGVTGIQVSGIDCLLCVVTIHGDNNMVADSRLLNIAVFGDGNRIFSSSVDQVEIDSATGSIVGNPAIGNQLRFLRLRSAGGTSVSHNSFTGSSLFPDAIEVSNGPVPATSAISIHHNYFSGYPGVAVNVLPGTPVSPTGVEVFSNTFVGFPTPIDLGDDGPTANDPAPDADGGPNNLQNYPVVTSAVLTSSEFTVQGTLTSAPLTQYRIDLYRTSGSGDERQVDTFDTFVVTTDAAGVATFTRALTFFPASMDAVLATANNQLTRDTSEIGGAAPVVSQGRLEFSSATYRVDENAGAVVITVLSSATGGPVTVHYATQDRTATSFSDYTPTMGMLTFAPGVTSQTFTVPIVQDGMQESSESFVVFLHNPTGGTTVVWPVATVTIDSHLDVPTVSQWGLMILAAALAAITLSRIAR